MKEHIALASLTTLRAGGPARYFFKATNIDDIKKAVDYASVRDLPILIIGGGSNILVSDTGFCGVVIKNEIQGIDFLDDEEHIHIIAGAGEDWDIFVRATIDKGLYGLENLSYIPGTVGAAPVQNIGAYGAEVADSIEWVEVFDTSTGEVKKIKNADCRFTYRGSIFKKTDGKKYIITRVSFLLAKNGILNFAYKDIRDYFEMRGMTKPTLHDMRMAIINIRTTKLPDMKTIGTAGSFFKNPIVTIAQKDKLLKSYPEMPWNDIGGGNVKLSAAWIIDHIGGWKGFKKRNVGVYEKQPLALVNYGTKNAQEIFSFASFIQEDIKRKTNIEFEFEVVCVGDFTTEE